MSGSSRTYGCYTCYDTGYLSNARSRWAEAARCRCRTPCAVCGGQGRNVERGPDGRTWVNRCDCWHLDKRIRIFNSAHLPAGYHGKTLETFEPTTDKQRSVVRWLAQFCARGGPGDRGALITGNPGVGKTHLVCAILRFLVLERGLGCRYVDSFQLLEELKLTYDAGTGASRLMDTICRVPILGIDELGKTRTTGWQREVLDQIISRRYDGKLTTFVTSNYGLTGERSKESSGDHWQELVKRETLEERVGSRIYSRLMEMCKGFRLDGADRRQT